MGIGKDILHFFENAEVIDDTSKGQRFFNKNIDRLCNKLIHYQRDKDL